MNKKNVILFEKSNDLISKTVFVEGNNDAIVSSKTKKKFLHFSDQSNIIKIGLLMNQGFQI